jgi:uncharacterized membrane protein
MAGTALTIVKVLHVVGAAMWLGAGLLFELVISPALRKKPIRERLASFLELTKGGAIYFPIVAFLTIVTGFELARQITGTLNPMAWDDSGYPGGRTLQVAFLFVLVAFVVGGANGPTQKKIRNLGEGEWTDASAAKAQQLFGRLDVVNLVDVAVLLIVTALMVTANLGGA